MEVMNSSWFAVEQQSHIDKSKIEEAVNFSIVTYVIIFAVWSSYTMFHGLSGEYPLSALVVTLLALAGMLVCGVFFCMELRRLSKES